MVKLDLEQIQKELEISTAIEQKLLSTHQWLSVDEISFLKVKAEASSPRSEFDYSF